MVSALLICVEQMAMQGAVALEQKVQNSALRHKAYASALGKKVHVVEKHKARQKALNQKALVQKAQASALGKKAHVVRNLKANQDALNKSFAHAMLSKVGCSKRRRLFHHSSKGTKAILAKASSAKKVLTKVIEVKNQAAEKLK